MNKYHPDKHPGESTTEKCKNFNVAYDILSDTTKKKTYDLSLNGQYAPSQPTNPRYTPPEPEPTKPYVYDEKWEKFLEKRPSWAKSVPIPPSAWGNKEKPVQHVNGITNIRPDLQDWGHKIIWAGKQYRVSGHEIQAELSRTWGYFCEPNSINMSLVYEQARAWTNRAQGKPEHVNVQFGV
jgi:curved DNA-binding protein CbpA